MKRNVKDEAIFRAYVEGAHELIQSIRPDGSIEYVNPTWLHTLRFSENDIEKITLKDYIFPGYVQRTKQNLSMVLKGHTVQCFFNILQTRTGIPIHVEGVLFPRYNDDKIVAAVIVYRNISAQTSNADTLLHEKGRSEIIIDAMVYDLIAINQEIEAIIKTALASSKLPPSLHNVLQEGLTEVERSTTFVSNIKELWRITRRTPQLLDCDLGESFFTAKEVVEKSFPHKKLSITTNLEPSRYYVTADEYLIEVFKSLLHHIAKNDTRTNVQIEVNVEPLIQTRFLKLQVKDHGPGMSDNEKSDIIDHLSQEHISSYGLGLDLTLARHVLENYGGYFRVEDRVENKPTDGSNFVLLLRCSQVTRDCLE